MSATHTTPVSTTWAIDTSHSSVGFTVRHLVISKVHGQFTRWTGNLHLDPANLVVSSVDVSIDAASIDTREPQRDGHLRSADFFNVEEYPNLTFKSSQVTLGGKDQFTVAGDLTIAGVTRPVTLEVEALGGAKDPWGNQRLAYSAKTSIDRREFGLTYNQALEAGGVLVGEKIEITLEIQAIAQAATPAV